MGFQTTVNSQPAPAVAGDFASANPRAAVLAPESGFVAGVGGVTVGRFAWLDTDGKTVFNTGEFTGAPNGFVHRDQQALITDYLGETSNVIPVGFPVTLFNEGDFYAKVTGATVATIGAAVYATYADGNMTVGAAATGASVTGSIGATCTASGSGTTLTTTSVTGYISAGDTISGTGVPAGTTIVQQLTGTAGGAGTYETSVATTASSATVTAFGDILDVTAIGSGTLAAGMPISGTGVPAGAVIESQISGTPGGVGFYRISIAATAYAASTTVTATGGVLTNFKCASAAAVGELAKISTWS